MASGLNEVKVHVLHTPRRLSCGPSNQTPQLEMEKRTMSKVPSRNRNYVYVNNGFTGSMNSVNANNIVRTEPPTSVIREQYCVCSKWPRAQRVLAITVGVLVGAVIGLAVSVGLLGKDVPNLAGAIL